MNTSEKIHCEEGSLGRARDARSKNWQSFCNGPQASRKLHASRNGKRTRVSIWKYRQRGVTCHGWIARLRKTKNTADEENSSTRWRVKGKNEPSHYINGRRNTRHLKKGPRKSLHEHLKSPGIDYRTRERLGARNGARGQTT